MKTCDPCASFKLDSTGYSALPSQPELMRRGVDTGYKRLGGHTHSVTAWRRAPQYLRSLRSSEGLIIASKSGIDKAAKSSRRTVRKTAHRYFRAISKWIVRTDSSRADYGLELRRHQRVRSAAAPTVVRHRPVAVARRRRHGLQRGRGRRAASEVAVERRAAWLENCDTRPRRVAGEWRHGPALGAQVRSAAQVCRPVSNRTNVASYRPPTSKHHHHHHLFV